KSASVNLKSQSEIVDNSVSPCLCGEEVFASSVLAPGGGLGQKKCLNGDVVGPHPYGHNGPQGAISADLRGGRQALHAYYSHVIGSGIQHQQKVLVGSERQAVRVA